MAALTLTEKLNQLGTRYDELTTQLSTSEVASDSARFQKVAKQHAELEEIVEKHRQFQQIERIWPARTRCFSKRKTPR